MQAAARADLFLPGEARRREEEEEEEEGGKEKQNPSPPAASVRNCERFFLLRFGAAGSAAANQRLLAREGVAADVDASAAAPLLAGVVHEPTSLSVMGTAPLLSRISPARTSFGGLVSPSFLPAAKKRGEK